MQFASTEPVVEQPRAFPPHMICPPCVQQDGRPSLQSVQQDKQHKKSFAPERTGIKIRYIMCTELFTSNQEELYLINLQPEDTMEYLINLICHFQKLSKSLTVELFSEEGCPLNVNIFTKKSKQVWEYISTSFVIIIIIIYKLNAYDDY